MDRSLESLAENLEKLHQQFEQMDRMRRELIAELAAYRKQADQFREHVRRLRPFAECWPSGAATLL